MEDIEEIESAHTVKRSEVKDETNMYLNYLESMKDNKTVICAHAYVRYMADLFGGQIMKRQLTKAGYPTNVYDFYGDVKTIRGVIATTIEECDETLFICESHHAFTCYALIL
jgi:stage III sporulation protein SpoIIIAA